MSSLQGKLLVASPGLTDPNFAQTVVLMVRHDDEGAFGLVLNRPTKVPLRHVWKKLTDDDCPSEGILHHGGPVQGPLLAVHTKEEHGQAEIFDGLYLSSEVESLAGLLSDDDAGPIRLFLGYAGWGSGQLETELADDSWLYMAASAEYPFRPADNLWRSAMGALAAREIFGGMKVHQPPDPTAN